MFGCQFIDCPFNRADLPSQSWRRMPSLHGTFRPVKQVSKQLNVKQLPTDWLLSIIFDV
ncbi:MAG: hypothetical protein ACTS4X_00435 [Candidatus Hodgkinia cicadicola]